MDKFIVKEKDELYNYLRNNLNLYLRMNVFMLIIMLLLSIIM